MIFYSRMLILLLSLATLANSEFAIKSNHSDWTIDLQFTSLEELDSILTDKVPRCLQRLQNGIKLNLTECILEVPETETTSNSVVNIQPDDTINDIPYGNGDKEILLSRPLEIHDQQQQQLKRIDRNFGRDQSQLRKDHDEQDTFSHRFKRSAQQSPSQQFPQLNLPLNNGNVGVGVRPGVSQWPKLHLEANHDLWKSRDGRTSFEGGAYYDRNLGRTPPGLPRQDYGGHVTFTHRFKRSPQEQPPQQQPPQQQPPQDQPNKPEHHGNIDVELKQGAGQGPKLHVEANHDLWKSRDGRTSFEGGAYYDRNLGRTQPGFPRQDYGGHVTFTHRFKRSPQEQPSQQQTPQQQPNKPEYHGNIDVELKQRADQGAKLHVEANHDLWKSRDGKTSFEGGAYYDRNFGRTHLGERREDFGGRIQFQHRFKRSAQQQPQTSPHPKPNQSGRHGNVGIGVEQGAGQGPKLHVEANHDLWKSRNGRTTFEGGAHYDRNFSHRQPGQPRQDYGGHVQFTHRFKRSPQSNQPARHGNVGIGMEQGSGQGPKVHVEANHNLWKSRDGKTTFEGGAHYDRNFGHRQPGQPRKDYGGQVTFTHRFKRSPEAQYVIVY